MLTLSDFKLRPQTQPLCFEGVSVPALMYAYKPYKANLETQDNELAIPEQDAIEFYLGNAANALISQKYDSNQPLSYGEVDILKNYYQIINHIGLRAFYYLLLICTRETRHGMCTAEQKKLMKALGTEAFWNNIHETNEMIAVGKLIESAPIVSIQNYTDHLVGCFELGGWSSSYGGPKWANVARPLRDFVHGKITMELLLDVVWTLAHNGGPIFNKGMLFHQYGEGLIPILDLQRAGQIPNLVAHGSSGLNGHITTAHKAFFNQVREVIPDFGAAPIDWSAVKADAVAHKNTVKVNIPIMPAGFLDAPNPFVAKKKKPSVPSVLLNTDKYFQPFPNYFVKKLTRAELK